MGFIIRWGGSQAVIFLLVSILIGYFVDKVGRKRDLPHLGLIVELAFVGAVLLFYLIAHDIGA